MKFDLTSLLSGKVRIFLFVLFILVSIGISGFITYQTLNLTNNSQEIAALKADLEQIEETKDKKVTLDEELQELKSDDSASVVFVYNNYDNSNPFKSLLEKKPKPKPKSKPEPKTQQKASASDSKQGPESRAESQSKEDTKSKEKQDEKEEESKPERPQVEFMGTVDAKFDMRAIIKIGGPETYVAKEGYVIKGLRVKKITPRNIIIEKDGYEFIYDCGGELCRNANL